MQCVVKTFRQSEYAFLFIEIFKNLNKVIIMMKSNCHICGYPQEFEK